MHVEGNQRVSIGDWQNWIKGTGNKLSHLTGTLVDCSKRQDEDGHFGMEIIKQMYIKYERLS